MRLTASLKSVLALLCSSLLALGFIGCSPEKSPPAGTSGKTTGPAVSSGAASTSDEESDEVGDDEGDDSLMMPLGKDDDSSSSSSGEQAGSGEDLGAEVPSPADAPEDG
ncbi:MAG: hypothetical protein ACKV0T_25910 [Planctomycetales bacterium]